VNVSFKSGEVVNGFTIIGKNGLSRFVADNGEVRILFDSDAGAGTNYSKVLSVTKNGRTYRAQRYLLKYVHTVQELSNALFQRWKEENTPQCICGLHDCMIHATGVYSYMKGRA
jgi:hypothetical protein